MCSYSGTSGSAHRIKESEMRSPRSPRMRVLEILGAAETAAVTAADDAAAEALSGPMQLLRVSDEVQPAPAADAVGLEESLVECESPRRCAKRAADCFGPQQESKRRSSLEERRDVPMEPAAVNSGGLANADAPQPALACDVSTPARLLPAGMDAVTVVAEGPLDEYRFNMFMNDLLAERRNDIVGFKGVLCVQGCGDIRFAIRGSRRSIRYGPSGQAWQPEESRVSRMVFIGRGLDKEDLAAGFRTCIAAPVPQVAAPR